MGDYLELLNPILDRNSSIDFYSTLALTNQRGLKSQISLVNSRVEKKSMLEFFKLDWVLVLLMNQKPGSVVGAYKQSRWVTNLIQGLQALGKSGLCFVHVAGDY